MQFSNFPLHLFVLAISPLIKRINSDGGIRGCLLGAYRVSALAYADDITVIIREQSEPVALKQHLAHMEPGVAGPGVEENEHPQKE